MKKRCSCFLRMQLSAGMPVLADTAQAISPPVTTRGRLVSGFLATIFCILSRSSAAFSESNANGDIPFCAASSITECGKQFFSNHSK